MAASSSQTFDFELLDAADGMELSDQDFVLVAAAETAQLAADQEEMTLLADYVVPPAKTPMDMVTEVNILSLLSLRHDCAGTSTYVAFLGDCGSSKSGALSPCTRYLGGR